MLLSKIEILEIAEQKMPMVSLKEASFRICDFAEAIERAVLAKAWQQWKGDAVKDAQKALEIYLAGFGDLDGCKWQDYPASQVFIDGFNVAMKSMPAPKQEPVHWRAVISDADKERNPIVSRHVVGFTQLSAAEEWAAAENDFGGWNYTIEPLYLYPSPPQAAAIPKQWRQIVTDLANELENEFMAKYTLDSLKYPSQKNKFDSDMDSVHRARAILAAEEKPEGE